MQLIAEAYDILKRGLDLKESEIADIFLKCVLLAPASLPALPADAFRIAPGGTPASSTRS